VWFLDAVCSICFWGGFIYVWKVPTSFDVCPSVCMYQLSPHWVDFCEILYLRLLWKFLRKSKFGYNWKIWALYVKTHVHFIVPGDIKSLQKHCSSQYVVQKCKRSVFLHFHGNIFIFDYIIDVSYFVYKGSYLTENTVSFHQKEQQ
jgi:hypothetical protein